MPGEMLGRCLGLALYPGDQLVSAALPATVQDGVLDGILSQANGDAYSPGGPPPLAVRIVGRGEHSSEAPAHIGVEHALRYRAGRRLLIWRDGDYDPDWSFGSTVEVWLHPEFPARQNPQVGIRDIAASAALFLALGREDLLVQGDWDLLQESIADVLLFLAEALERVGNGDRPWNAAWWDVAALYLDTLDEALAGADPGDVEALPLAYAAAGLPVPRGPRGYARLTAQKYAQAVKDRWSSLPTAKETLAWLEARLEQVPALRLLPWDGEYARSMLASGHVVSALTGLGGLDEGRVAAWLATDEDQFLGVAQHKAGRLVVCLDGDGLPNPGNADIYVLPVERATLEASGKACHVTLAGVEVQVPWMGGSGPPPAGTTIAVADIGVSIGSGWAFDVEAVSAEPTFLLVQGTVHSQVRHGRKWPDRALPLGVQVPIASPLHGRVDQEARARVVLPCPWVPTAIVAWGSKAQPRAVVSGGGPVDVAGTAITGREEPRAYALQIDKEQRGAVMVYDGRPESAGLPTIERVVVNGQPLASTPDTPWPVFAADDTWLRDGLQVVAEDSEEGHELVEVSVELKTLRPWLPLAATAIGVAVESGDPRRDMEKSLRGELEELQSKALRRLAASPRDSLPGGGLWQCVLPVGHAYRFHPEELDGPRSVKWFAEVALAEQRLEHVGAGPSSALLASAEAGRFWNALRDVVTRLPGFKRPSSRPWPSRWQLVGDGVELEAGVIEEYLEAFAGLVAMARELEPPDHFWASYPFCAVLYDFERRRTSGVLLSPLHPVRLAWLYGAERAVSARSDNEGAASLVQVAEGWNFPWIGPAPAPGGNPAILAAVPVDPGPGQLFMGWSALVRFDNTQGEPLTVPSRAAGLHVPGGSASGLNEGGVGAALRDFLRIYPHLPTLNVDIYASTRGARSTELDRAVLVELAATLKDKAVAARLPGGLRVHDSLNREGYPPSRDEALEMFFESGPDQAISIEWRRYDPSQVPLPSVDLRLVEDAQAQVAAVEGSAMGSAPRWPVRRFGVHSFPLGSDGDVRVNACLSPSGCTWGPYAKALASVERVTPTTVHALQVRPNASLLASRERARWVVSGSIHLNPGALARAVATAGEAEGVHRMLWEWRPAHLPRRISGGIPRFERRPYTTIAAIPAPFEEALAARLGVAAPMARQVFNELGRRGVGLASLLAIGGNHALGALGFFFGFKILECASESSPHPRVIVPVDAIDSLLRAIAGKDAVEISKRADLLVIEARMGETVEIVFIPVEIKARGFDASSPAAAFPVPGASNDVSGALDQLRDTQAVLKAVVQGVAAEAESGDTSLDSAALGAIVESAFLLAGRDYDPEVPATVLAAVAAGTAQLSVGRGLLLWLQDTPRLDAEPVVSWSENIDDGFGIMMVDPAMEAASWSSSKGTICAQAASALSWCAPASPGASGAGPVPEPSPPGGPRGSEEPGRGAPPPTIPASLPAALPVEDRGEEEPAGVADEGTGGRTMTVDLSGPGDELPGIGPTSIRVNDRPQVILGRGKLGSDVVWDPYHPARRLNNAHVVILGASGAGKTQVTRAFIHELCGQGMSALIFDFKDDYVAPDYLASIGGEMLEADEGIPVNPLAVDPDPITGKLKVQNKVYEVAGTLKKVYRLGDQQEAKLRNAIAQTYVSAGMPLRGQPGPGARMPTFREVKPFLEVEGDQSLVNRLSPIFDLDLFTGDGDSLVEYLRKPTVIRLSQLPTEEVKKATAEVVLMSLYNALLRLGHCHGVRLAIVVDEAHKIANLRAMNLLLKEARAYGAAVILSSQEARDFEDTVFSNAGSLLALKLSETKDSERVAGLLAGSSEAKDLGEKLRDLRQFHGLFRNDHYRPYTEVEVVPHYKRVPH